MHSGRVFWGISLVLAAALVIASQVFNFGAGLSVWVILGLVGCTIAIVGNIASRQFYATFFLFPLACIYALLQEAYALPEINAWILIACSLLAGIGIDILTAGIRHRRMHNHWKRMIEKAGGDPNYYHHNWHGYKKSRRIVGNNSTRPGDTFVTVTDADASGQATYVDGSLDVENSGDDNHPVSRVRFGSSSRYLHSDALSGGLFDVSFGALEIFCDDAKLAADGAEIEAHVSFGSLILHVPANWRVSGDGLAVTIGAAPHRGAGTGSATDASQPKLTIRGTVSFGSIEVERI